MTVRTRIMDALPRFARGATALELAAAIGSPLTSVGSVLSKATNAGEVWRTQAKRRPDYRAHYVYHLPIGDVVAPLQPPAWQGARRVAARVTELVGEG